MVLTYLTGFLWHKIAALLRDIDGGLDGLIVTLFLAGLKLATCGGAVLPRVLVTVGISDKSSWLGFINLIYTILFNVNNWLRLC